jgi:hypothetical protein
VYFTGSNTADVTVLRIANVNRPNKPEFQDFGDMMLRGTGYVRVDWFTPTAWECGAMVVCSL